MDNLPSSIVCHYHSHSDIPQLRESRGLQERSFEGSIAAIERADPGSPFVRAERLRE
jgi:hypothetical protein